MGSETNLLYTHSNDERYYYNDYEQFNGMKVGMLANSFQNVQMESFAAQKGFQYQSVNYDSSDETFRALDAGEVDAVVMGSVSAINGYKVVARIGSDPFYFMARKEDQQLINTLDDALLEIFSIDPYYKQKLFEKYYEKADATSYLSLTRAEAEFVKSCKPITVGLFPNRFPYSYIDKEGNIGGIVPDIFNLIAEKSGLQFNYVMVDTETAIPKYLQENADSLVGGVFADNEAYLSEAYTLSHSFLTGNVVLVCREGQSYDLSGNSSCTVAVPMSYQSIKNNLLARYPNVTLLFCAATKDCLDAVQAGKADLAAQNLDILLGAMQNPHYDNLKILSTVIMEEPLAVVGLASEKQDIVIGIIDKSIATVSESQIEQILISYSAANTYSSSILDFFYKYNVVFTAICALLLVGIIAILGTNYFKQKYYTTIHEKNLQLEEAIERANQASIAKSTFLSQISHDMRTPMNGILGIAYLSKEQEDLQILKQNIAQIEQSGKLLLSLINDTLDMSRIESGKAELNPSVCDEKQLFDSIINIVQPQIIEKNINLDVSYINVNWATLYVDAPRIQQVFINLLSNAVKFTPVGGKIELIIECLAEKEKSVCDRFIIRDNGIGMSEEFQAHMFEPFAQENRENKATQPGTGLGLSIVKSMVELMNGTLTVNSKENQGTEFIIELEFSTATAEIRPKADTVITNPWFLKNKRILLCEDNQINTLVAQRLLEKIGGIVESVENGMMAVEKVANSATGFYSAILMDIRMPVMDGLTATREIRKLKHLDAKIIPIIAMSANAFEEDIQKSLEAGMNAHLSKPIIPDILYATLETELSGASRKKLWQKFSYAQRLTILLVDDMEVNLSVMETALENEFCVITAANGKAALEKLEQNDGIVAVITDLQMPTIDGKELIEAIRKEERYRNIAILANTQFGDPEQEEELLLLGADDFVYKPTTPIILSARLKNVLKRYGRG
ncbi:MAG: response regulator [Oscillospiraceae bacterium]|nr:response regulator [Oscillospiraceae bacterium]